MKCAHEIVAAGTRNEKKKSRPWGAHSLADAQWEKKGMKNPIDSKIERERERDREREANHESKKD